MVNNWLFEGKELLPDVITKQGNKRQVNPTKIPMVCDADLESIPIPDKADLVYISKYQKLIGELMFLCVNTCPEISYALSALSRYLTQATLQLVFTPSTCCVTCGSEACQINLVRW